MNKKIICGVFVTGILAAGAAGLSGQVKYGGYLSAEYLKGESGSENAGGSFQNLGAGFLASGVFSSKFGFSLEARVLSESSFQIEQAWVGLIASKSFSLKAGMYLVPFGIWNQASRPHETALIGTPLNLEFLYPASWRDLGVIVGGQVGILTYAGYLGNGLKEGETLEAGQQFSDNNKDKAWGGRLGLAFGDGIQAGASYYTGKYDDLNERRLELEGIDFSWVTDQWEVRGEATRGIIKNPASFAAGKCEGYSIWTVMNFGHVQPVGSYQTVKYVDPFHGGEGGILLDRNRWTAGLRFVIDKNLFIKAEYQWNDEVPKVKNNILIVQAALSF
jgi:hypothetical protein